MNEANRKWLWVVLPSVIVVGSGSSAQSADVSHSVMAASRGTVTHNAWAQPQPTTKGTKPRPTPRSTKPRPGLRRTQAAPAQMKGRSLLLTGLTMAVPDGWEMVPPDPSLRFSPVAIFKLPPGKKGNDHPRLRITYFPRMKGLDQANIDRWLRQVKGPDGQAFTRDTAAIKTFDIETVHLTIVDVSGTVREGMGRQAKDVPHRRLIAAIVDHPNGPHFIRVSGDVATMKKAEKFILQFLKSAKTR